MAVDLIEWRNDVLLSAGRVTAEVTNWMYENQAAADFLVTLVLLGALASLYIYHRNRRLRKFHERRGAMMSKADRKSYIAALAEDFLTDGFLQAELEGKVSYQEVREFYQRYGVEKGLKGLLARKLKPHPDSVRANIARNKLHIHPKVPGDKPPAVRKNDFISNVLSFRTSGNASKFWRKTA